MTSDSVEVVAKLDGVTFTYPNGPTVFEGFSWSMATGESWSVIGTSGCGKSTLLYLLAGLLAPDGGSVEVGGTEVRGTRFDTGLVLQDYGLLPWATAIENVRLGLRIRGHARREASDAAADWLVRVGLGDQFGRYPNQLSGGQRQRVAIARTLALAPELLLLDEPFSSLDALTRESMQAMAIELGIASKLSTVIVTHDIDEAVLLGRRILIMGVGENQGRAAVIDNPEAGDAEYRERPEFHLIGRRVRETVRELSADLTA